jgi:hypothetical protein
MLCKIMSKIESTNFRYAPLTVDDSHNISHVFALGTGGHFIGRHQEVAFNGKTRSGRNGLA